MTEVVLHPWRALYWEPVAGTGERLMVGVVYRYAGQWGAARIIRDDVLAALYGTAAAGARKLIDTGLDLYRQIGAAEDSLDSLDVPLFGLQPAEARATGALSVPDLLRTAALLYSSLANLDKLDALDEADSAVVNEEAQRRFGTDIRAAVEATRPDLHDCFGRSAQLITGGDMVRFGYASTRVLAHFNVLNPMRHGVSLRDTRARLFELDKGRVLARLPHAVLLSGVQRNDDPTLGDKQRARLAEMKVEIAQEADVVGVLFRTAESATDAADQLLELETA